MENRKTAQTQWGTRREGGSIHEFVHDVGEVLDRISGFTGWIGNARERRVRSCSSWHPVFPSAGLISTFKFDGKPGDREVLTLADRSHCDRGDV